MRFAELAAAHTRRDCTEPTDELRNERSAARGKTAGPVLPMLHEDNVTQGVVDLRKPAYGLGGEGCTTSGESRLMSTSVLRVLVLSATVTAQGVVPAGFAGSNAISGTASGSRGSP